MKTKNFLTALVIGGLSLSAAAYVASAEENASEPAAASAVTSPVAAALANLKTFNGTPSADAKYYIFLESASWCPPCRKEMPHIVKAYPEMKENQVELVLIGADGSPQKAEEYLKTYNATFPGVFGRDPGVANLPGFKSANYVPHAVIVDSNGNVLADGHGSITLKWKEIIQSHK